MLQFQNGRLWVPGASTALPDGFYLNTDPGLTNPNTVHLISENQQYSISICFDAIEIATDVFLTGITQELEAEVLIPPTEIAFNGLVGHWTIYQSGENQYFEACLQFSGNDELNCIDVIFMGDVGTLEAETLPEIQTIMQGLRQD